MASVFTKIIQGELPARWLWQDEFCVAFLSINPISVGHSLVVTREEVDHWLDVDRDLWLHVSGVSQVIGQAIQDAFDPPRVGQMIAGFEVPHLHVHVLQIRELGDLDFAKAQTNPDPDEMEDAAAAIRGALKDAGYSTEVPSA